MSTTTLSSTVRRRLGVACGVALGLALGAGAAGAQASAVTTSTAGLFAVPPAGPQLPTFRQLADAADGEQGWSSSASAETGAPENFVAAMNLHSTGLDAMQYGGRRRYGRPRYRGGNTNDDGSQKYTFFVGAGLAAPVTDNSNYLTDSWGFKVGAGRNFNKHLGVSFDFDYDHFGFTSQTISNQAYLYTGDPTNQSYGIDGNSHIWSFTLNPTYTFYNGETTGAYVVVGGGFYHKVANFFVPQEECYYYCYVYDQTFDNYTSNAAGVNGGIGLTYKFSKFANQRFFAEARVVHTFNEYRPGLTAAAAANGSLYTGFNYFPQNSQDTTWIPVKVGLRF